MGGCFIATMDPGALASDRRAVHVESISRKVKDIIDLPEWFVSRTGVRAEDLAARYPRELAQHLGLELRKDEKIPNLVYLELREHGDDGQRVRLGWVVRGGDFDFLSALIERPVAHEAFHLDIRTGRVHQALIHADLGYTVWKRSW